VAVASSIQEKKDDVVAEGKIIDFIKTVDSKIVLIDGEKLAKLMFDHNIGFESGGVYQLKKIDEDFFAE